MFDTAINGEGYGLGLQCFNRQEAWPTLFVHWLLQYMRRVEVGWLFSCIFGIRFRRCWLATGVRYDQGQSS